MTTITVEVPDHLATKIEGMRDRLPDLLSEALMLSASDNGTTTASSLRYPVLEEMIDFLCSGPTLEEIIAFKISARTQERLAELLDKNREEGLSEVENAELDAYEHVDYVMSLLKARARVAAKA
jgi:hypothetical protein